jgi:antitoxin component of MazEF toxin-antitoxin module
MVKPKHPSYRVKLWKSDGNFPCVVGIPSDIVTALNLTAGDYVRVRQSWDNGIVIRVSSRQKGGLNRKRKEGLNDGELIREVAKQVISLLTASLPQLGVNHIEVNPQLPSGGQ